MDAGPAVLGALMGGTAFAVYVRRAPHMARQKAQPGGQQCPNCLTWACSRCSAARTFWVWGFLKHLQSHSPRHLQKMGRPLCIPVLEAGEREITECLSEGRRNASSLMFRFLRPNKRTDEVFE